MKITAYHVTRFPDGMIEHRQLDAEFTDEFEFPHAEGSAALGIAGRSEEIKAVGRGLMEAILAGIEGEEAE